MNDFCVRRSSNVGGGVLAATIIICGDRRDEIREGRNSLRSEEVEGINSKRSMRV
jgi:hypothetical protein